MAQGREKHEQPIAEQNLLRCSKGTLCIQITHRFAAFLPILQQAGKQSKEDKPRELFTAVLLRIHHRLLVAAVAMKYTHIN